MREKVPYAGEGVKNKKNIRTHDIKYHTCDHCKQVFTKKLLYLVCGDGHVLVLKWYMSL